MPVLQRKLFNRGGSVARGTGITSGLVPVQKFAPGGEVTGTAGLLDTGPVPAGKILDGGSFVDNQTYTTQVPTLEELTEKIEALLNLYMVQDPIDYQSLKF